ncbi:MAG: methyltransferase domain-containing protein [Chloroflexi bacterium]|jgi:ubiquinone/menaquinone biosynthesis C-methylase UbiE|nr:methyltransferase domain-containing protein [Chloroflexota bacterium]
MSLDQPTIQSAKLTGPEIKQRYTSIANVYDIWGKLTESKAQTRCLELANIVDGQAVLEVAVGTGLTFSRILERNPSGLTEGIDLTAAMLARAQQKASACGTGNYNLRVGSAYHLPYDENSFDVLINNYMFDLLPQEDFERVLTEFGRVLRPSGRLVLANMAREGHWYNQLWEAVYRIQPAWLGGCRGVSLLPYVQRAGFTNTKREFISQMTFPSEIIYGERND